MDRLQEAFQVIPPDADEEFVLNERRRYVQALRKKWAWFLDDPKAEPIPENMKDALAILCENQHGFTLTNNLNQILASSGVTKLEDVAMPLKWTLPIIRAVYPQLWVNKVASVQPLPRASGGTGTIFWLDFLRSDVTPQTSLTVSNSSYAASQENAVPKRVKLTITSTTITTTKDILGATWSSEVAQDAMGVHGIDVEQELIAAMSDEILREQEMRCINAMWNGATAGTVTWHWTVPDPSNHTEQTWYETLAHAFVDAEMYIAQKRYRLADWICCGTNVFAYLQKMKSFVTNNLPADATKGTLGVKQVGQLNGRWDVYLSHYMGANHALVGCYPTSQLDTAFIFAPYIPLMAMPLVYAEYLPYNDATLPGAYINTDKWSRNVSTRYGYKVVVGDLLAKVQIEP